MAYFTSGFIFTQEPDWQHLEGISPKYAMRGYRYKHGQVWMLDIWEPHWRKHHFPFQSRQANIQLPNHQESESVEAVISQIAAVETIANDTGLSNNGERVRTAVRMAAITATPLFYFEADDDLFDFACRCDAERVAAVGCAIDSKTVIFRHEEGESIAWVRFSEEDEEEDQMMARELTNPLEEIGTKHGIEIRNPEPIPDGVRLHDQVLATWPSEAGDATEILGLGSWDAFANLDQDFEIVFDRPSERGTTPDPEPSKTTPAATKSVSQTPKRKRWWQFWR